MRSTPAILSGAFLPGFLGLAGGAMLYVISGEMIPETHSHGYEKPATLLHGRGHQRRGSGIGVPLPSIRPEIRPAADRRAIAECWLCCLYRRWPDQVFITECDGCELLVTPSHCCNYNLGVFCLVSGEIRCTDYQGTRVVLNIFPSLDTPVCATSVRRFNKEAAELPDVKIINVSIVLSF